MTMTIADIRSATDAKMNQSLAAFQNNLTKIRTGRANPALLDSIHVDYYGSSVPLSAGGQRVAARFAHHQRPALGKGHGRQDREGHPRKRPGPEPAPRWAT